MITYFNVPGGATQISNRKENVMGTFIKLIGLLAAAAGLIVFFGLLFSLPVMLLWNSCLVPAIPGIKTIGWLQAWGINILCGFLFKNSSTTNKE